jgi:hypothetical protein
MLLEFAMNVFEKKKKTLFLPYKIVIKTDGWTIVQDWTTGYKQYR